MKNKEFVYCHTELILPINSAEIKFEKGVWYEMERIKDDNDHVHIAFPPISELVKTGRFRTITEATWTLSLFILEKHFSTKQEIRKSKLKKLNDRWG